MAIRSTFSELETEEEYEAAVTSGRRYFERGPDPGALDEAQFDMLVQLIEQYEAAHYKVT